MATNFPTSLDSYTTKADAVDVVQAAHINNLQDAVVAIETKLGIGNALAMARSAGAFTFALDAASGSQVNIPNTSTAGPFGAGVWRGLILVSETSTDGSFAVFATDGSSVVEVVDVQGNYSTTAATGSSTNVYWSGTTLTVENRRGGARTYTVIGIRLS